MWSYSSSEINYKLFYYPQHHLQAIDNTEPEIRCRIWYALNRLNGENNLQILTPECILKIIDNFELFQTLSIDAKRLLIDKSPRFLFDADEALREVFLHDRPTAPTEQFQQGDCFGEMALFMGHPLPKINMVAVTETELLAVTPTVLQAALDLDNISIDTVATYMIQYYHDFLARSLQEISVNNLSDAEICDRIRQHSIGT